MHTYLRSLRMLRRNRNQFYPVTMHFKEEAPFRLQIFHQGEIFIVFASPLRATVRGLFLKKSLYLFLDLNPLSANAYVC